MPERYATIDVGSNSVLLHVAERAPDGRFRQVADLAAVTRLAEGVAASGRLAEAAMARTAAVVVRFVAIAHKLGTREIAAVGTAGLRRPDNARDFVRRVRELCGLTIAVVPGDVEARLAWLGVRTGLPEDADEVFVVDVGGASTELVHGAGGTLRERLSVDVGAVVMTEGFLVSDPVADDELRALLRHLDTALAPLGPLPPGATLTGTGGTITTLGAVFHGLAAYDAAIVHGTRLARAVVEAQLERFRSQTVAERRTGIPGLPPDRADVIVGGAAVVLAVLRKVGAEALTVSDRGVRHGLLVDRFGADGRV
jgi:exopolyphosphatase/guanosine-5'-triphosphate,3'-diphosphate pyrophosphatase